MSDIKERLRDASQEAKAHCYDHFADVCSESADHIATLEQESAANLQRALVAEKDAQRLDFMIENNTSWYPGFYNGKWQDEKSRGTMCYGFNRTEAEGSTMREAIDAARADISTQEVG